MKKFSIGILALIYLVVCSGVVIDFHYCMGKMAYADLAQKPDRCNKCGMKTSATSCCKHELKVIKLADSHTSTSNEIAFTTPVAIFPEHPQPGNTQLQYSIIAGNHNNHSPPDRSQKSLCILNCTFRI